MHLLFILIVNFNTFEKIYLIYLNDYDKRLKFAYGNCDREGYGFVKKKHFLLVKQIFGNIENLVLADQYYIILMEKMLGINMVVPIVLYGEQD